MLLGHATRCPDPDERRRDVRILVLGARGMVGHMACRIFGERHEVFGTIRRDLSTDSVLARFLSPDRWIRGVDALDMESVRRALDEAEPDAVLNCIGVIKQHSDATDPIVSIENNSLFPHKLAALCNSVDVRMVHLSTDCVFSGRQGMYTESDIPDPTDLYGRSKLLGETERGEGLTLRTSVVGREIHGYMSLFEWVLGSRGSSVRGFDRAVYSGLTTMALVDVVGQVMEGQPDLTGVWHVASEPITKYELLRWLNENLDLDLDIERDESFVSDRSLDGSALTAETGIVVPSWDDMLTRFVDDQPSYAGLGEESP